MAKEKGEQKPETMEEFYKKMVDEMRIELREMRERNVELLTKYVEMSRHIKEVRSMTQRSLGVNPDTNTQDERALDKTLDNINDGKAIVNGVLSHVYRGRAVSIKQRADKGILFYFGNHNSQQRDEKYRPTTANLSEESFVLILEAMEFAAKKFDINRKEASQRLTGTDKPIEFKNIISHL